jgi:ribulose kinase
MPLKPQFSLLGLKGDLSLLLSSEKSLCTRLFGQNRRFNIYCRDHCLLTARGFSATGSLFMHLGKIVPCLRKPKSVRIPSIVREIGKSVFTQVSSLVDHRFEEGLNESILGFFHGY